jgi:hypothetical protein
MDKLMVLFPSDYFNKNRVDDDLKKEYDSVMRTGTFGISVFSYDDWFHEGVIRLDRNTEESCLPEGSVSRNMSI